MEVLNIGVSLFFSFNLIRAAWAARRLSSDRSFLGIGLYALVFEDFEDDEGSSVNFRPGPASLNLASAFFLAKNFFILSAIFIRFQSFFIFLEYVL